MYPEAPPTGYIALVELPALLQLHAVMPGIVMANTIPSTILMDL